MLLICRINQFCGFSGLINSALQNLFILLLILFRICDFPLFSISFGQLISDFLHFLLSFSSALFSSCHLFLLFLITHPSFSGPFLCSSSQPPLFLLNLFVPSPLFPIPLAYLSPLFLIFFCDFLPLPSLSSLPFPLGFSAPHNPLFSSSDS